MAKEERKACQQYSDNLTLEQGVKDENASKDDF
nr:hypothetical protein Itr_chr08CG18450 [Ipomoea trifida]GMD27270.1 hypothetical protein Iba_chr08dCG12160 [Ipomoea batatas]